MSIAKICIVLVLLIGQVYCICNTTIKPWTVQTPPSGWQVVTKNVSFSSADSQSFSLNVVDKQSSVTSDNQYHTFISNVPLNKKIDGDCTIDSYRVSPVFNIYLDGTTNKEIAISSVFKLPTGVSTALPADYCLALVKVQSSNTSIKCLVDGIADGTNGASVSTSLNNIQIAKCDDTGACIPTDADIYYTVIYKGKMVQDTFELPTTSCQASYTKWTTSDEKVAEVTKEGIIISSTDGYNMNISSDADAKSYYIQPVDLPQKFSDFTIVVPDNNICQADGLLQNLNIEQAMLSPLVEIVANTHDTVNNDLLLTGTYDKNVDAGDVCFAVFAINTKTNHSWVECLSGNDKVLSLTLNTVPIGTCTTSEVTTCTADENNLYKLYYGIIVNGKAELNHPEEEDAFPITVDKSKPVPSGVLHYTVINIALLL